MPLRVTASQIRNSAVRKFNSSGGTWANAGARSLPHRLNERNLIDLFQGRHTQPNLVQRGLAQEPHPFFTGGSADFRSRLLGQNHFADAVAQIQKLVNGGSPAEAGSGT